MGGFGQIMKNMLNWQPSGSPAWQRQQEEKIRQSQEDRAQQQADMEFHQHMMDVGALPVVNGMVKEQQPLTAPAMSAPDQSQQGPSGDSSASRSAPDAGPTGVSSPGLSQQQLVHQMLSQPSGSSSNMMDDQGNPNPGATFNDGPLTSQSLVQALMPGQATGNVTIVRKAEPASTVKWKDASGGQVAYELPSPDSQRWRQMMAMRAQNLQQQTAAEEKGRLDAQNQQRETYGTPLSGDLADKYGVDPNQKLLPMEKVQLATKYYPVVGAGLRSDATKTAAQIRADAANYKTDLDNTTKQAIADQSSMDRNTALDHRDKWNAAIEAAKGNGQNNLNARAWLANSSRDMGLHTTLLGDISKENQKQMLAQSLLAAGPDGQPVTQDGDQFPDPFSGRTLTMNSAQRLRLRSAFSQSQQTVAGYQQAAAQLESRRDQILNRFGAPGAAMPGASAGGPASSPGPAGNSKPLLWRGSGAAPTGSSPVPAEAPTGGPAGGPQASAPGRSFSNGGSAAPAAGPGSVNWAPRGRGVQQVAEAVNAPARAAARPPATSLAAGPQAKMATQNQVRMYAQKKGITPAAALEEFKASGYTVQ